MVERNPHSWQQEFRASQLFDVQFLLKLNKHKSVICKSKSIQFYSFPSYVESPGPISMLHIKNLTCPCGLMKPTHRVGVHLLVLRWRAILVVKRVSAIQLSIEVIHAKLEWLS